MIDECNMMGTIIPIPLQKNWHKIVLKLMHPGEFSKRPKPTELMMRSRVVDHLGKRRLVLFAIAKEKAMEEDDKFVMELLFVEDIDSRTSLS